MLFGESSVAEGRRLKVTRSGRSAITSRQCSPSDSRLVLSAYFCSSATISANVAAGFSLTSTPARAAL